MVNIMHKNNIDAPLTGTKLEKDYNQKYGGIPSDLSERIQFIKQNLNVNLDQINKMISEYNKIPWKSISFSFNLIPYPTPRGRYSPVNDRFYVKGASEHQKFFRKIIDIKEIIATRTEFYVTVFQPTPVSVMTKEEVLLAELGYIKPMNQKDWDNLGKTYSDMIQGSLLLNDCIIAKGTTDRNYSIRPRVEIKLDYMATFDSKFNEKRMRDSKYFEQLIRDGKYCNCEVEFDERD